MTDEQVKRCIASLRRWAEHCDGEEYGKGARDAYLHVAWSLEKDLRDEERENDQAR